ncbi:MAG: primosomal protein N' [Lentisphaeria bacterium]|nr:primosomal protein N' [Lentisphaeria bacterium]
MTIARVIVDLSLDRAFDYLVPPELESEIRVGTRVTVPFNRGRRDGFVLDLVAESEFPRLKTIIGPAANAAHLPPELVRLGEWMAEYYCCTREQAVRTLLPGAVRGNKVKVRLRKFCRIADPVAAAHFLASRQGKTSFAARLEALRVLSDAGETPVDELTGFYRVSPSSLRSLAKAGLVVIEERAVRRDPLAGRVVLPEKPLEPTGQQRQALDLIGQMLRGETTSHVLLLHGVTNSGKTEVYLQAIAATLAMGKTAIMLVPEISLTPQTVRRFRARFGDRLSVLHSRLSDGERFDEWHRIRRGEVDIVVGARSALFAPFENLGLIVVDEEHESSYKQSEAPRYSARDVAVVRGRRENAVVILGSATPSAESCRNAMEGRYLKIAMTEQACAQLQPVIRIIDLSRTPPEPGRSNFFSPEVTEAIHDRLERHEQTILFLNRRGFARVMTCDKCGFEARCPNCSVCYTYSRKQQQLTCYLCGESIPAPEKCPECGDRGIRYLGLGTEKIEAAAMAAFSQASVARMDSDTMRSAEDYERTLEAVRRGEIDILIGTQMIAKGLHFPNVTLVGLINADAGLLMDDFRASERGFQLIAQVAGRAGRGDVRGEVLIQTYHPENEVIRFAADLDFAGFSAFDLEVRSLLGYPPYTHLIALYFRGEDEDETVSYGEAVTRQLRGISGDDIRISGPCPAPIERIKGKYRYLTVIRGNRLGVVRRYLRELVLHGGPRSVEMIVDVDAQSLL